MKLSAKTKKLQKIINFYIDSHSHLEILVVNTNLKET